MCLLAFGIPLLMHVGSSGRQVTRKELVEATDRIADQKMLIEKLENALENQTSTPKQREQSSTSVKTPVTSSFSHDSQLRALLGE